MAPASGERNGSERLRRRALWGVCAAAGVSLLNVCCSARLALPASQVGDAEPLAVEVISFLASVETYAAIGEGTLIASRSRYSERLVIDDRPFVKRVRTLYEGLRPARPSRSPEFTIEALLIWRDGEMRRVGVLSNCGAMTREGTPVAFDRELYELLASRLSEEHRTALRGDCALKRD